MCDYSSRIINFSCLTEIELNSSIQYLHKTINGDMGDCKTFTCSCRYYGVNFQHPVSSENHLRGHVATVNSSYVHCAAMEWTSNIQYLQKTSNGDKGGCKLFPCSCRYYGVNFQHPVSSENHLRRHVGTVNSSHVHGVSMKLTSNIRYLQKTIYGVMWVL